MKTYQESPSWISPATKRFVRTAWKIQVNAPWDFLHSFFYARWPYRYIALANTDYGLIQQFKHILRFWRKLRPRRESPKQIELAPGMATGTIADIYHGKVLPLAPAQELLMVNEPVNLPDLEQVIPYQRARALILEYPEHILQVKCPCRMAKKNPCQPVEVCLIIGEPFTSMISQHYPDRSKWISAQEACAILEAEDARGRVHHAFFSEMMLGRFFAICNCCSCCCTAMSAHQRGTPMLAPSGYLAEVDQSICNACLQCEPFCQFGALSQKNGSVKIEQGLCMGCGVCTSKCPLDAIAFRLEASNGIPLEIFGSSESAPAGPEQLTMITGQDKRVKSE